MTTLKNPALIHTLEFKNVIDRFISVSQQYMSEIMTLDPISVDLFVKNLKDCKGKIVITGQGKSGISAQKWVESLLSIGIQAAFLDSGKAFHGDIGMLKQGDILIVISKNGSSQDLANIISFTKVNGILSLGIFNTHSSILKSKVDHCIIIDSIEELDANNLMPSVSTMYQIAVGDIITSMLMRVKNISDDHLFSNHPGGFIGYQNTKVIADLIDENIKPKVNMHDSINEVIINITSHKKGATLVTDNQNNIRGIITDGDLRRMLQAKLDINEVLAEDIMTSQPKTIEGTQSPAAALRTMQEYKISQLIVTKNGEYIGMINQHDLTHFLV